MRTFALGFLCVGMLGSQAPAAVITFTDTMSPANEVPPTTSTATGSATVTLDTVALTLAVAETFSGLTGPATAAHIHCCALPGVVAPVAVPFSGFPAAASGTYTNIFDLTMASTYNPAFLSANGGTAASAEAAFIAGLESFRTYTNIHTTANPGGEIRGQLAAVPEPATLGLTAAGLLLAFAARRRARRA